VLVITAFQRSGTTALGEQIGAMPAYAYWGEVFHADGYRGGDLAAKLRLRPGANWHRFLEDDAPGELRTGPQEAPGRREAWRLYAERLLRLSSGRLPVLDVKYNSWRNLDPVWSPITQPPFLFTLLDEQRAAYVHLVRENVLAQALSEVFAFESGLWHRRLGQTVEVQEFRCEADTVGLLARMRESRAETAVLRTWLQPRPHIELVYEHAFEPNGDLSEGARVALSNLGVDTASVQQRPVLGRTGQDPRQWLSNTDEVLDALAGTEFEDLAEAMLG
jgi:hypothetical protein